MSLSGSADANGEFDNSMKGKYRLLDFNIQDISLYVARFNAKNERGEMVSPGICLNEKRLSMILEKGKIWIWEIKVYIILMGLKINSM